MASILEQVAAAKAVVPAISPQEAAQLQAKGALIVDVRDAPELLASGKVEGRAPRLARHARVQGRPEVALSRPGVRPGQDGHPLLRLGRPIGAVGQGAQGLGFKDVRNLGAFKDWAESGQAVEKV